MAAREGDAGPRGAASQAARQVPTQLLRTLLRPHRCCCCCCPQAAAAAAAAEAEAGEGDDEEARASSAAAAVKESYDYLLSMAIYSLTWEKVQVSTVGFLGWELRARSGHCLLRQGVSLAVHGHLQPGLGSQWGEQAPLAGHKH